MLSTLVKPKAIKQEVTSKLRRLSAAWIIFARSKPKAIVLIDLAM